MLRRITRGLPLLLGALLALVIIPVSFADPGGAPHAREKARGHLKTHGARYGLKGDLSDLRDGELISSQTGWHVRFQQMVGNVPVENGMVNVGVDPSGNLQLITSGYKPNLGNMATNPRIDAQAAVETARAAVGPQGAQATASEPTLVIYAEKAPALAWKVALDDESADQPGSWNVFVNARNGQVLHVRSLLRFDGTGRVFNPNPVVTLSNPSLTDQNDANYTGLAGAYQTVTLRGIDTSGYLRGPYVDLSRAKGTPRETSGQFLYARNDTRFEHVMAYYHIDLTQRYIQSLGFTNVNSHAQIVKPNGTTADNSFYSPNKKTITLGTGGVDDGEDADVIIHEYGHAIQDNQVPGFGSSAEGGAMGEGFGDYLAFTMYSHLQSGSYLGCVAEWDAVSYDNRTPPCLRRVDENKHYPEDLEGEVHADGEIWSRALFDLWNALGKTKADRLVIQSHFYLTPSATFRDGANAILAADRALYGGANETIIRQVFGARGIPMN